MEGGVGIGGDEWWEIKALYKEQVVFILAGKMSAYQMECLGLTLNSHSGL